MSKKNGQPGSLKYSAEKQEQRARSRKKADSRWASRSGAVVTSKIGEEKQPPPPPTAMQQRRQDRRI